MEGEEMEQTEQQQTSNGGADWADVAKASEAAEAVPDRDVEAIRARCTEKRRYSTLRRIPLDVAELAQLGQRMAGKLVEIESLEEERKGINEQIKELRDGVREIRAELSSGRGERKIEVVEYHDEDRCHVYLVRTESDEVVEDRTMTAAERQGEIHYEAGAEAEGLDDEHHEEDDDEEDQGGQDEADDDELDD